MSETSVDTAEHADWLTVSNTEGRHSIWPATRPVPEGWQPTGQRGERSACLAWIAENWTDPRPAGVGRVAR
ncbi:MbtH family protein [Kitasatospora terrestris]|uniref:MbtH family protein n=1 Tax=Kitasatospora terrestris TaxID=258051 RepID=A0ABP9D8G5_9ACTN